MGAWVQAPKAMDPKQEVWAGSAREVMVHLAARGMEQQRGMVEVEQAAGPMQALNMVMKLSVAPAS